ncbi:MAG: hypothetical protein ACLQNG_06325 [Acidimicrobiales bacterium]
MGGGDTSTQRDLAAGVFSARCLEEHAAEVRIAPLARQATPPERPRWTA